MINHFPGQNPHRLPGQGVTVKGLVELNKHLMDLAKQASDDETDRALLGLAHEMKAKMQQKTHPDLRYAIVAKPFSHEQRFIASAFVAIDRNIKDGQGRTMGRLAHLFEFGTGPRYRESTKKRGGGIRKLIAAMNGTIGGSTGAMFQKMGVTSKPFFRPVVDEYQGGKFLARLAAIIEKQIERGPKRAAAALADYDTWLDSRNTGGGE